MKNILKKLMYIGVFFIVLVLVFIFMDTPEIINRAPTYVRIEMVDGEEEIISMRSLVAQKYETEKAAFELEQQKLKEDNENYEIIEWDPFEYYSNQYILYPHPYGEDLIPEDVVTYLIEQTSFKAIDYDQSYWRIAAPRSYFDLSDSILLTSFYEIWLDGDDANFDGVVDELDEEFYGQFMTDEDGNYVYNTGLSRMRRKRVGEITEVSFFVKDEEGREMTIKGLIIIVESQE